MEIKNLNTYGIIGFDGLTKHGLKFHPDQKHLIYSMGSKVTIKNIETGEQSFLSGHNNVITTLTISPCGKYIASGQLTHLGFKAMVIIWNYDEKNIKANYEIHKGKVEDVSFTCKSDYLISLGGKDDGNVIVWDIHHNRAICGAFASTEITGNACTIIGTNIRDKCFLSGGQETLRLWIIDPLVCKIQAVNIKMGKLRRCINCICIDDKDEVAYWGTSSGDIIETRLNFDRDINILEPVKPPVLVGCYSKIPSDIKKLKTGVGDLYAAGVTALYLIQKKKLIVGTGDGTLELTEIIAVNIIASSKQKIKLPSTPQIKTLKTCKVQGAVTSIMQYDEQSLLVGTSCCEICQVSLTNLRTKIIITCHTDSVYDIAFPYNYSEIFATASKNDIRLWHLESQKELLRIIVPNFVCTSICFSYDGKLIISAWNDGIIRAFKPQSGILYFVIENAHIKAVSAIGLTKNGKTLVSGGCDGQVRVWKISKNFQDLKTIMKEHRGPITALHITYNDENVVSSSTDGTCIIWDLLNCSRKQVIMGNTMYMSTKFHPNGLQLLTCGTDRKIAYWETLDGSIVREVEGSTIGAINCLDIHPDGQYFITGGNDCLIKFWEYTSGEVTHIGTGHAAIVTACRFSPDGYHIVTTSADGTIIIWINPIIEQSDDSKSVKSIKSRQSSEYSTKNQKYNCQEENVENISHRSVANIDSIQTVYSSKKNSDSCNYDPIQPSKDNCRNTNDFHDNFNKSDNQLKSKDLRSKQLSQESMKLHYSNNK
ncbi:cilia- and flagella-associated protein 52 [Chelonus insularis]|uniref:cilia- and flagella-associated protein 52 n=1 Tax=Chelonus insularis TaxID=460826 RepID=UPI00158CAF04|nr:cilia- and flagella-associated protein 52 [Chelonus insularis]